MGFEEQSEDRKTLTQKSNSTKIAKLYPTWQTVK